MSLIIDAVRCDGCGICYQICPEDVFVMEDGVAKPLRADECWYCGSCVMDCAHDAIRIVFPWAMRPVILRGSSAPLQSPGASGLR